MLNKNTYAQLFSGEPRDPNLIWKDVIHPIFKLLLGLKETIKQQVIIQKQPLMIFVLMHWGERDSSDSSVEPDPPTDSLEADVHTFLVARATSHKWCEGRSCSALRPECPNVSVALDCSCSMGQTPQRADWLFCQGENLDLNVEAVY